MLYLILAISLAASLGALARALHDHRNVRKRISDLEVQTATLRRQLKERGELASELAHEIKSPITAILCSAEALDLLVGPKMETSHRACLKYIKDYGDILLRMLSDFLDLTRTEAGQISNEPEAIALKPLLDSVTGLLQSAAIKKRLVIRYSAPQELCVYADPRHLKQILCNLLQNAIRHSPQGADIRVEAVSRSGEIGISIIDQGPGVPAGAEHTIFDPYAQLGKGGPGVLKGEGLGLAICRALIETQKGSIKLMKGEQGGAHFKVILPAAEAPAESSEDELPKPAEQPLAGENYLLVAEDGGAGPAMARLIEAWGGVVQLVNEATAAVQALSGNTYSALMVDNTHNAAKENGELQNLFAQARSNKTPIIMTAANEAESQLAESYGVDLCLSKPLDGEALLRSLCKAKKI